MTVRVTDQGIGIAPQDREHLFEKFTQVGDSAHRQAQGHRPGAWRSARRSSSITPGASGWRASLGEGSTFAFTVPVVEEPVDVIPAAP